MVNTSGLTLSGSVCHECGLIHPPIDGPCPMAAENKKKETKTHISPTQNKEEIKHQNNNINELKCELTNLINEKLSKLEFENDYVEEKFYKILRKTVIDNLKGFLNDYKQ